MARRNVMTAAERFFWKNAGYCYDPKTQTKAQGRRACATEMAEAEAYMQDMQWRAEWSDDFDADHQREFGYTPTTCESCTLYDADGNWLASLGCVDDASNEYRRVIEAQLADEAYHVIKQAQRADTEVYSYCAL